MNFGFVDLLTLIGSIGLFLYGMKLMSEGLQKAAGDRLRNILAWMTNNRFVGALTGILVTALIQSSSATTVMIVSFVNAGLLSLGQSMAVIMGANVGTTATAWILYLGGFKVNLAAASIPIIAFTLPMMFSKKNSWNQKNFVQPGGLLVIKQLFPGRHIRRDQLTDGHFRLTDHATDNGQIGNKVR